MQTMKARTESGEKTGEIQLNATNDSIKPITEIKVNIVIKTVKRNDSACTLQ